MDKRPHVRPHAHGHAHTFTNREMRRVAKANVDDATTARDYVFRSALREFEAALRDFHTGVADWGAVQLARNTLLEQWDNTNQSYRRAQSRILVDRYPDNDEAVK